MKFKGNFLSPKRDVVIYLLSVLRIKCPQKEGRGREGGKEEAREKKRKGRKGNGRNKLSSDCQGLDSS